jgi:hypothetical protein
MPKAERRLSVPNELHLHERLSGALTVTQTHSGFETAWMHRARLLQSRPADKGASPGFCKTHVVLVSEDQEKKSNRPASFTSLA